MHLTRNDITAIGAIITLATLTGFGAMCLYWGFKYIEIIIK